MFAEPGTGYGCYRISSADFKKPPELVLTHQNPLKFDLMAFCEKLGNSPRELLARHSVQEAGQKAFGTSQFDQFFSHRPLRANPIFASHTCYDLR